MVEQANQKLLRLTNQPADLLYPTIVTRWKNVLFGSLFSPEQRIFRGLGIQLLYGIYIYQSASENKNRFWY